MGKETVRGKQRQLGEVWLMSGRLDSDAGWPDLGKRGVQRAAFVAGQGRHVHDLSPDTTIIMERSILVRFG